MKYAGIQYIVMLLAAMYSGKCITHLVHLNLWISFGFLLTKDIALVILVIYLFRLTRSSHKAGKLEIRNLVVRSMLSLLLVSMIADIALTYSR